MVSLLLAAIAVWSWPTSPRTPARRRTSAAGASRARRRRVPVALIVLGATVLIGLLVTPAAGAAAGVLTATVSGVVRSELAGARRRRELVAGATAVRMLAREVRAGVDPISAVAAVAAVTDGAAAVMLGRLQAAVAMNAQPEPDGPVAGQDPGSPEALLQRLLASWRLAARHGVSWAAVLDALVVDLSARAEAAAGLAAQAAGPRMSGYVLAALPLVGMALGAGMGADPAGVLFGPGVGGLLLVVGTALTCAGLAWTRRLVRI